MFLSSSNQGEFLTELIVFVEKAAYESSSNSGGMTVETALQAGTIPTTIQIQPYFIDVPGVPHLFCECRPVRYKVYGRCSGPFHGLTSLFCTV